MNNLKKIGIVIAVLAVVIIIAVVTREQWLHWVNQLINWVTTQIFGDDTHGITLTSEGTTGG